MTSKGSLDLSRGLATMLLGLTLASTSNAAGLTNEQQLNIINRSSAITLAARQRLLSDCKLLSEEVTVPAVTYPNGFEAGSVEGTSTTTQSIASWSGGCKDGLREGEGDLLQVTEATLPNGARLRIESGMHGLFVAGKQLGPWRITKNNYAALVGAYIIYGLSEGPYFIKRPDGSFAMATPDAGGTMQPVELRAPISAAEIDTMIAETSRAWAANDPRSTKPLTAYGSPIVESSILKDLLKDSKARRAESAELGDLSKKNLLIVVSNRTTTSFARMDDFRKTVDAWAVTQSDPLVRSRAGEFSRVADKKAFVDRLASQFQKRFAKVEVADDLSSVRNGQSDYALVLDLVFDYRLDQFLSSLSTPGEPPKNTIVVGMSYIFLNKNLLIVRDHIASARDVFLSRAFDFESGNSAIASALDRSTKLFDDTLRPDSSASQALTFNLMTTFDLNAAR